MELTEAIKQRHSVRQYEPRPLDSQTALLLQAEIDACNAESGLHFQLITNEPKAFDSFMAHYGKFSGVINYIGLVGKKDSSLEEKCGYYGERIVLKAQQIGLNTCWVAMSYSKAKTTFSVLHGEKLCVVIAVGYGKTQGVPHKSKAMSEVSRVNGEPSDWFVKGVEAALLAPTALNQQKFILIQNGNKVTAKSGLGFYTRLDLGIVKYHFEIGAGKDSFCWA